MPAIPFPVFTLVILLILLVKVVLTAGRQRGLMYFIAGCSLLVLMSALRWSFDARLLRQAQSLLAILFAPLTWCCFAELTGQTRLRRNLISVIPPALALALNLAEPATTDGVLTLLYMGYGVALLRTSRQGADAFVLTRLTASPTTSAMAFAAGCFLCFSALTDLAIAIDFSLYAGRQAPLLVAISQGILLPFICLAILFTGRQAPPQTQPEAELPAASLDEPVETAEAEAQLCERLEALIVERGLFLDPDLTLNLLARRTTTPARQISRAVNLTRGCNVSQWINGFRIQHAQHLLRDTEDPVTSVMLASGFITKSNFNREFTRVTGMNPTDYRRAKDDNPAPGLKSD